MPDFSTYEFPEWAGNDELKMFVLFFVFAGIVLITRAALRWYRSVGEEGGGE